MFSMFKAAADIRKPVAWLAAIAAGLLVVSLIMIGPAVGVADNGDFARVMGVSGIAPLEPNEAYADRYFAYSHTLYGYGGYTSGGYISSHVALVAVAGWISRLFDRHTFDIRYLGACYLALFLTAVALLVRYAPAPPASPEHAAAPVRRQAAFLAAFTALAAVWIFGDIGYVAYFQSFFGEPYAFVAMLLAIAAALAIASKPEDAPAGGLLALFVASAFAVATAKIQNAPLGLAFALLAWRLMALRPGRRWRRQTRAALLILAGGAMLMLAAAPNRLVHTNLYQSIFYGVLKDSPDPAADMRELGIPAAYAGLAGTNYFQKDTVIPQRDPVLRREVLERLGHKDIALFYAKHPGRLAAKLEKAAAAGAAIRPYYLGNYAKSAGFKPHALSYRFSSWSEWKHDRMPHRLGELAFFFAAYAGTLAVVWLRSRSRRLRFAMETLGLVALCGVFAILVPIVGDGEADLAKHLFMFNVCFDMMVLSALVGAAYGCVRLVHMRDYGSAREWRVWRGAR